MNHIRWLWIIIGFMLILTLFLVYQMYIVSVAIDELLKLKPILQELYDIEQEVKEVSGQDTATCREVALNILACQQRYPKSPLSFKLACLRQESSFRIDAVGPCGEQGLTQIYYLTWHYCHPKGSYYDWHDTLPFGFQLMDEYWIKCDKNAKTAAMMYNGGPGIMHRSEQAIAMASRHGRRVNSYYEQYRQTI